ncbi:MAG: helix-turn-helix domain-containing protein [Dehalococcoidia bacterium]
MILTFDERPSDSPYVERIWRSHSERSGLFLSIAMSHWEMVVTRYHGKTTLTVRGPETMVTLLECPAEGEWIGIRFKLGTVMPYLPASTLVDQAVDLPDAGSRSFWLQGSAWDCPDFENAEAFVKRLVRERLVVREPVVDAALYGHLDDVSARTAQRHILRTTGLTHRTIRQIERARYATTLLQQGVSILDTVHEAGYFDQSHLTHSLKALIGQTPTQISDSTNPEQLSYLYKTLPLR